MLLWFLFSRFLHKLFYCWNTQLATPSAKGLSHPKIMSISSSGTILCIAASSAVGRDSRHGECSCNSYKREPGPLCSKVVANNVHNIFGTGAG